MINRQKKFLREIIASYFGASDKELCSQGGISEKTLKSDLQMIQNALKKYQLSLCEKDGRISIPFEKKEDFLNAYEEIIREDEGQTLGSEAEERKIFILSYLCRTSGYISMNMLADKMYVSKSSISGIVHELEKEIPLIVPMASISISSRKGMRLNADEKAIRELLVRTFVKGEGQATENRHLLNYLEKEYQQKLYDVQEIINAFLYEHHFVLSNENITKLIVHIMIIIQRTNHGCYLEPTHIKDDAIFKDVADALKKVDINISYKELSSLPLTSLNRAVIENPLAYTIVSQFIEWANNEYHEELLRLDEADSLIAHLDELLKKGFRGTHLNDFTFDQMLQRLLSAYMLCGKLCELITAYTQIKPDNENRVYMAMHVQGLYRKHVVIREDMLLYESNISQCNMIKTDLEKHFGSKATITPIHVRWDIEKRLTEKNYALILGTKSILGSFGNVPFLKIHPFINNQDYEAINRIVYKNRPVKIFCGNYLEAEEMIQIHGVKIAMNREIICINDCYLMTSLNDEIETMVVETNWHGHRFFLFNYNSKDTFLYYHRMINGFGQMMKEQKI